MLVPTAACRRRRVRGVTATAVVVLVVVMAACSSDDDSSSSGEDTSATSEESGQLTEMTADDEAEVDAAIAAGVERVTSVAPALTPPGLWVGVWDPAKGAYLTAQGDAATGQPATIDDHFRIGSTTKTLTASVILQLVDEGKLALDDTIGALLPDLAATHPEITDVTVESLLSMTSRIEDYANVPDSVTAEAVADPTRIWTPEELIAAGVGQGLLPEGTAKYSTTNFIILQLIAESIERRPLAESIEARLTSPLGMTESSLPIEDPSMPEPFAAGHINDFCVQELEQDGATGVDTSTDPTDWSISWAQGGGGMTSTLADLGRWADSNSGNSFLSPELQAERLVADSVIAPGEPEIYALGILKLGESWFGHPGEAIGWQALAIHNPDTGVSLAFATNTCSTMDLVFWSIINELYPDPTLDAAVDQALAG